MAQTRVVLILWPGGCRPSPSLSKSTSGSGPRYLCDFGVIAMDTDKLCHEMINFLFYTSPSLQSKVHQPSQQEPWPVPMTNSHLLCRFCPLLAAYTSSGMPLLFYPCCISSAVWCKGLVLFTETRLAYSLHCWKWSICPFQWSISK